tara:strand:+ start:533 stop:985 length:453 start_codon:yes stop_codon:yes gene_type:complete
MADIAKIWNPETMTADLALDGASLVEDAGLTTRFINALFTDARAPEDLAARDAIDDRRGAWSDFLSPVEGDENGSLLWTLRREKQTPEVLNRARAMSLAALRFAIEDGLCTAIDVETSYPARGRLAIRIIATLPDGRIAEDHFETAAGGA